MIKVTRLHLTDMVQYNCKYKDCNFEVVCPFDDDESEGKVISYFKHKIADRMANELKFEISTIEGTS